MGALARLAALTAAFALALSTPAVAQPPLSDHAVLYGFEPFGTFEVNPTRALVAHLSKGHPQRTQAVLSVSPEDAMGHLYALMAERPRAIIGFGVRADVQDIEVNTAATNWLAMRSESSTPYFGAIDPGLPTSISLPGPWRDTVASHLQASRVPHTLSPDAGLHACNLTFFQALVHAPAGARVLFVHVAPDIMQRPDLLRALETFVDALLTPDRIP